MMFVPGTVSCCGADVARCAGAAHSRSSVDTINPGSDLGDERAPIRNTVFEFVTEGLVASAARQEGPQALVDRVAQATNVHDIEVLVHGGDVNDAVRRAVVPERGARS
jgi:hypothetical protein